MRGPQHIRQGEKQLQHRRHPLLHLLRRRRQQLGLLPQHLQLLQELRPVYGRQHARHRWLGVLGTGLCLCLSPHHCHCCHHWLGVQGTGLCLCLPTTVSSIQCCHHWLGVLENFFLLPFSIPSLTSVLQQSSVKCSLP